MVKDVTTTSMNVNLIHAEMVHAKILSRDLGVCVNQDTVEEFVTSTLMSAIQINVETEEGV